MLEFSTIHLHTQQHEQAQIDYSTSFLLFLTTGGKLERRGTDKLTKKHRMCYIKKYTVWTRMCIKCIGILLDEEDKDAASYYKKDPP